MEELNKAHGQEWLHEGIALIDGQRGLVTYLRWDLENWDHVFWLVRHPLHTVFSLANLIVRDGPPTQQEVAGRITGKDVSEWTPVRAALESVATFIGNAEREHLQPWQLEEIPGYMGSGKMSHGRKIAASWATLIRENDEAADLLYEQTVRLGYSPEGSP